MRKFDSFGFIKSIKIAYTGPIHNNDSKTKNNTTTKYRHNYNEDDSDDNDVYYTSKSKSRSSSKTRYQSDSNNNHISRNTARGDGSGGLSGGTTNNLYEWFAISVPSVDSSFCVKARFLNAPTELNNLAGFNNTGNICKLFMTIYF